RRGLRQRGICMCIPPKRRPKNRKAKRGRPVVARKEDYRQRFKVEIVHPQMTKPNGGTVAGGGEDVADLHITIGDNDAVDQEFDRRPPLLESRCGQSVADLGAKRLERRGDRTQGDMLLRYGVELALLGLQGLLSTGQREALAFKGRQGEDFCEIGVEQALL